MSEPQSAASAAFPVFDRVRGVDVAEVRGWLTAGWRDMRVAGWSSIAYGMIFVVAGFAITGGLVLGGMPYLITPMIAGFLLVGPLLAVGLYDMSRRIEAGERPRLGAALLAWRANTFHILTAGLILMLFLMIWARIAVLIFALTFPYETLSLGGIAGQALTPAGAVFLLLGTLVGGALAAIAFVTNVTALPMMLDRKVDFFSAGLVSVAAVARNPRPMLAWAAIIVAVTALGVATAFVGLAVALPLLGHASWHAYRGLVRAPRSA